MAATLAVLGLWVAFAATHIGLSSLRVRPRLVAALGERGFLGFYSLIALALFVPLVWVYAENRQTGPLLWAAALGPVLRWLLYLVMGLAWVLVVVGLIQPSPVVVGGPGVARVRGAHRLTRHPFFMGVGLFAALHLVLFPETYASDGAFFSGFVVFTLLGSWHQDRRKLRTAGEPFRTWHAATPFLPLTGRETWKGLRELPPLGIGLGVVLTIALRLLHEPVFG